jgi:hypothetical protein
MTVFLSLLLACRPTPGLVIVSEGSTAPLLTDMVAFLDDPRARLEQEADPAGRAQGADIGPGDRTVAVLGDLDCAECYELEDADGGVIVHGGLPLGVQYGLADTLERIGYRFFHPSATVVPTDLDDLDTDGLGTREAPEQAVRGLSPHTLHPIEMTLDGWVPSEAGAVRTRRVLDWLVKNRGNYLQGPALDDILEGDATRAAWAAQQRATLDVAHARGVRVGIGVQLFGGSNLQRAYDLLDDASGPPEARGARIESRLATLLDGLDHDAVNISFGEFSQMPPDTFLENLGLFTSVVRARDPSTEISAVIHVGDTDDTRVTYQDVDQLYYFLVRYADPSIVPYIHTVMYYNLFDDAGGAYHHEDFSEHRAYLEERLAAGQPVAYFPETAYWCAFDNTVPTYLPLYVYSRWRDLDGLQREAPAPLQQHVTFSSGWEWGYWQNDVATLRMGWRLPGDVHDVFAQLYAPWGSDDLPVALADLARLQHEALIVQRLAPWMAGRDILMEAARGLGILSQPDRPTWAALASMSADARESITTTVLLPLRAHADATETILRRLEDVPGDDAWLAELRDGVEVHVLRARFMASMLDAVLAHADGRVADARAAYDRAVTAMENARRVVRRRADGFHDDNPERLVTRGDNPTIYDFGYLHMADTLCFWERDRVQVARAVLGEDGVDPGCAL